MVTRPADGARRESPISVLAPAFDETAEIGTTLARLSGAAGRGGDIAEIVVVEDGAWTRRQ